MAIVTPPTDGGLLRADQVVREVYIGGVRRADAVVNTISLSAGLAPTLCEVVFPALYGHQVGAQAGATVEVWCNRERYPLPLFRGTVVSIRQIDTQRASLSMVTARDVRGALDDGFCTRDFNRVFKGRTTETLRLPEIAAAILAECNAHQAAQGTPQSHRLALNTGSLPNRPVGQYLVRGESWGAALQRLLDEWGRGRYRLAVEYGSQSSTLFAFVPGQGALQETRRGTDREVEIADQAWGPPNAGEINDEINHVGGLINDLTLEASDVVFEQRVALVPSWPGAGTADFEALLTEAIKAQQFPLPNGLAPIDGDPTMASVGRRYRIPDVVDLDGVERPLDLADELVQAQYYDDDVYQKVPNTPFVAAADEDGRWLAMFEGWSLSGRDIIFDEPKSKTEMVTETRDLAVPVFTPVTDFPGYPGSYYWGYLHGMPAGAIGSGLQGFWTEPNQGGAQFELQATSDDDPNPPDAPYKLAIDLTRGVVMSTVDKVVYGHWTQTHLKRTPMTFYLNAAWISRTRITGSSGKLGEGALHIKRLSTVEGYRKRVLKDHLRLEDSVVTAGTAYTLADISFVSGTITVEDDSTTLEEIATARVRATMEPLKLLTRTLPRGDLGYRIGEQLSENGVATGCSITEVIVDLVNMTTKLTAANR